MILKEGNYKIKTTRNNTLMINNMFKQIEVSFSLEKLCHLKIRSYKRQSAFCLFLKKAVDIPLITGLEEILIEFLP